MYVTVQCFLLPLISFIFDSTHHPPLHLFFFFMSLSKYTPHFTNLCPKGSSLSAAHILGLAAFVVHLQACSSQNPLVKFVPPLRPEPVPITEALSVALVCSTHTDMLFCIR